MAIRSNRSLVRDQRGSVAIIFGLVLTPAVTIVGMAVDYGTALSTRTKLQMIVDSAAVAGANLPATANQNRQQAALDTFNRLAVEKGLVGATPHVRASNSEVAVTAEYQQPTSFMGLLGVASLTVSGSTVARPQIQNGGVACMLALNPTANDALSMIGITKVQAQNCWSWVNSSSSSAINASGTSLGSGQGFCAAGRVVGPEHFQPVPYDGCEPMEDPFAASFTTYAPASNFCTYNNKQFNNGTFAVSNPTGTVVFCGGLELKPNANVTLAPGIYVIKDGELGIQAQSSLVGEGVVLYFTGNSTTKFDIRAGGNVSLKAPATGQMAGFVVVQQKYASPGADLLIRGGGDLKFEGILYTPTWRVVVSGNSDMNQNSKYLGFVADTFHLEGNGKLFVASDNVGASLPAMMPRIKNGPVFTR